MDIQVRFLGAAESVTGSRHLLEFNHTKVMIDCGLYQERALQNRNWEDFGVDPAELDAVLLTHAHLDHCGLLPKLAKEGFAGKVYCTEATADIAEIVLMDSGKIQEEDAEFKIKRHKRAGYTPPRPVEPLYNQEEARQCTQLFSPVQYNVPVKINGDMEVTFHEAGHIFGSSIIRVVVKANGEKRTIIFTGDLGRIGKPMLKNPAIFDQADYVFVESTYGDRVHTSVEDTKEQLCDAVNKTFQAGGNLIVPSFSIERAQEVLYYMNELVMEDRIPNIMCFLDSPMAVRVTKVFEKHPELYDKQMARLMENHSSPFTFKGLKLVESTKESKAINHIKGTIMVIAGSGMCTGGRVKHHLVNNISRPECAVVFVGYQAVGTLGRQILEAQPGDEVRILGQMLPVNAAIVKVHGFSAHADREEILTWLRNIKNTPRKIFVVHGEKEVAHKFKDFLIEKTGWDVMVPQYQDVVKID
jgi:metallo-beta-lactamase family protein